MKLIKQTYILTFVWLIPVFILGGLFSFFTIKYITNEETDEFLTYEMERLVKYHQENSDLPEFHNVAAIYEDVKYDKPVFKDTLLLEPGDNEMVPYRELYFTLNHNGRDFTIVLRHLLPGRDDIAEGTILITSGIMFLVTFFLFLMINLVTGKIWQPFYRTLEKITRFKIGETIPVFEKTKTDEFNTLNSTLHSFLKKISDDYRHNKEFNENASHELQTHLAIIKANAGKLLGNCKDDPQQMDEINKIYSSATKLSQIQKSLLLLSKINNREFSNNQHIQLENILATTLETFAETISMREIELKTSISKCDVFMDAGLAEIMLNNLIKNAVKHNTDKGFININLTADYLQVENSGSRFKGNPEMLIQRFSKGENGNIGIGLAIVNEICQLNGFRLIYKIEENRHKIEIIFKPA